LFEEQILDGRNRYRACRELDIPPRFDVFDGTAEEAAVLADVLNLDRRHLTREQKRAVIAYKVKQNPERSDRDIAAEVRVDHKTVAAVRKKAVGEFPQLEPAKRKGRDGKSYKATKSKRVTTPAPEPQPVEEVARAETHPELGSPVSLPPVVQPPVKPEDIIRGQINARCCHCGQELNPVPPRMRASTYHVYLVVQLLREAGKGIVRRRHVLAKLEEITGDPESIHTTAHALNALVKDGWIEVRPRTGYHISARCSQREAAALGWGPVVLSP